MNIAVLMPDDDTRRQFLPPPVADALNALGDVAWNPGKTHYTEKELPDVIAGAKVLVSGWGCPFIDAKWLDGTPRLLAHTGGTVAPFVNRETLEKGLRVISVNDIYARSTAEGAVSLMLCALRQLPYWDQEVRLGRWRTVDFQNQGLYRRRVGLVGYGTIASFVIPILKAFGAEVFLSSGHLSEKDCAALGVQKASIEDIFSTCEVISLHASLTEQTRGMVGESLLKRIQDDALFVNTSRGAIVDEDALIRVLKTGRIKAALDVFQTEPLALDSPLRGLPNVLLLPHMAGPTRDLYPVCGFAVVEEARRFLNDEPLTRELRIDAINRMTTGG